MLTEEEIIALMNKEIAKSVEKRDYRVFQSPLELELARKLAEKKDSSQIHEFLFTLYSEMKHAIQNLVEKANSAGNDNDE